LDIREIRRTNLTRLIQEHADGNVSRFVEVAGLESVKGMLQVTGPSRRRNLGSGLARQIESAFGLERGWMDRDHSAAPDVSPVPGGRTERALKAYSIIEALPVDVREHVERLIDALAAKKGPVKKKRRRAK
jgi:hypothetical protein